MYLLVIKPLNIHSYGKERVVCYSPSYIRFCMEWTEGLKNIILYSKATIEIDDKDVNINELNITIRTLYAAIKIDWQDILEFT